MPQERRTWSHNQKNLPPVCEDEDREIKRALTRVVENAAIGRVTKEKVEAMQIALREYRTLGNANRFDNVVFNDNQNDPPNDG